LTFNVAIAGSGNNQDMATGGQCLECEDTLGIHHHGDVIDSHRCARRRRTVARYGQASFERCGISRCCVRTRRNEYASRCDDDRPTKVKNTPKNVGIARLRRTNSITSSRRPLKDWHDGRLPLIGISLSI